MPSGEGPRTALRVEGGLPRHLAAHLERLVRGAEALGEPVLWLRDLGSALEAWVAAQARPEGALRLGLDPAAGLLTARFESRPVTPDPYRLLPLPHPLGDLRGSPLARHKGLTGPWRQPVVREARTHGADDALLFWPDGTVAETAIASLALERSDALLLAPTAGRVASLGEDLDLPSWAEARGLQIRWEAMPVPSLASGRLWCVNAVRGIWPAMLMERTTREDPPWAPRT